MYMFKLIYINQKKTILLKINNSPCLDLICCTFIALTLDHMVSVYRLYRSASLVIIN